MNLEPKSIIPFISSEEGMVTKFTVILVKPLPLDEVIELCGSGKGKRITNEQPADTPDLMFDAWRVAQLTREIAIRQDMIERIEPYKPEPGLLPEVEQS